MNRRIDSTAQGDDEMLLLECGHRVPHPDSRPGIDDLVDCHACDRRSIPTSTRPGRRTPTFDHASVPPALLADHRTSAWAELCVIAGSVNFYEAETTWSAVATPEQPIVIVPDRYHHIVPHRGAEFYVQFHDLPKPPDAHTRDASE